MIIKNVNLETVCGITSSLPNNTLPEIALVVRSNVGKSSLINVLINRKSYAKTSSTPGKTQTINFYNVNNNIYLVDLPGYGYTKTSRAESDKWAKMINNYLEKSQQLRGILQLVDLRHEPTALDKEMFAWIKATGMRSIIVGTKLDKIPVSKIEQHKNIIKEKLKAGENAPIMCFSSLKKIGREELWEAIYRLI